MRHKILTSKIDFYVLVGDESVRSSAFSLWCIAWGGRPKFRHMTHVLLQDVQDRWRENT